MIYVVGALTYCVQYLSLHNDLDKVITDERLLALAGRDSFLPEEFNLLRLPCPLGGGGGWGGPAVFSANGYGGASGVESCNGL